MLSRSAKDALFSMEFPLRRRHIQDWKDIAALAAALTDRDAYRPLTVRVRGERHSCHIDCEAPAPVGQEPIHTSTEQQTKTPQCCRCSTESSAQAKGTSTGVGN